MGLDIFFCKIKSPDAYNKLKEAMANRIKFQSRLSDIHSNEIEYNTMVWSKWFDEYTLSSDSVKFEKENPEPKFKIQDAYDKDELAEWTKLKQIEDQAIIECDKKEIDELHMRKVYWMTDFIRTRNKELDEMNYLKNNECFLYPNDMNELLERMDIILKNAPAVSKYFSTKTMKSLRGFAKAAESLAKKYLPEYRNCYDEYYFMSLLNYRKYFNLYKNETLLYVESW